MPASAHTNEYGYDDYGDYAGEDSDNLGQPEPAVDEYWTAEHAAAAAAGYADYDDTEAGNVAAAAAAGNNSMRRGRTWRILLATSWSAI